MRSEQPHDTSNQTGEDALDRGFSVGHKRCCMSTCFTLDKRPVERGWRKPLPSRRSNLGASVSKPSIGPAPARLAEPVRMGDPGGHWPSKLALAVV